MKPPNKHFTSLPVFDICCKRVDTTSGMFIECICGKILKPELDVNSHLRTGMSKRMIQIIWIR